MLTVSRIRESYLSCNNHPRALIASLLAKISDLRNLEKDTAWIYVATEEQIEEQLLKIEQSSIEGMPLYGIPFAIKDNIDVKDWETTVGDGIDDDNAFTA